jgi:hypothetical protein
MTKQHLCWRVHLPVHLPVVFAEYLALEQLQTVTAQVLLQRVKDTP